MTFRLALLAVATMLGQVTVSATHAEKQLKDVSGRFSVKDSKQQKQ